MVRVRISKWRASSLFYIKVLAKPNLMELTANSNKRGPTRGIHLSTMLIPERVELEIVTLNFSGVPFSLGDDRKLSLHNPADTSMQTDSTEESKLHACRFL